MVAAKNPGLPEGLLEIKEESKNIDEVDLTAIDAHAENLGDLLDTISIDPALIDVSLPPQPSSASISPPPPHNALQHPNTAQKSNQ